MNDIVKQDQRDFALWMMECRRKARAEFESLLRSATAKSTQMAGESEDFQNG